MAHFKYTSDIRKNARLQLSIHRPWQPSFLQPNTTYTASHSSPNGENCRCLSVSLNWRRCAIRGVDIRTWVSATIAQSPSDIPRLTTSQLLLSYTSAQTRTDSHEICRYFPRISPPISARISMFLKSFSRAKTSPCLNSTNGTRRRTRTIRSSCTTTRSTRNSNMSHTPRPTRLSTVPRGSSPIPLPGSPLPGRDPLSSAFLLIVVRLLFPPFMMGYR